MEDLYLKKTFTSPEVEFIADTGELSLEGRSIPEDPGEFFEKLIEWINEYFLHPAEKTVMSIKLEYINSGSSKYMLEVLRIMKIANAPTIMPAIQPMETCRFFGVKGIISTNSG